MLAVAIPFELGLDSFHPPAPELILAVQGIEKPGNLGAMLRTAAAVGAAVLVCDLATDLFNPSVVRASLGALFTVKLARAPAPDAREWLDRHSIRLLAAVTGPAPSVWTAELAGPVAVAVGAEHSGLSSDLTTGAKLVTIPMAPGADSLNASVAAAVFLYEAARQRQTTSS